MRIGVLCSRIRAEEKLLFEAFARQRLEIERIDDRELVFDLASEPTRYDISGSGPSGENDTALAVSYFFSASQRLVIEGGIDALEGSQRR